MSVVPQQVPVAVVRQVFRGAEDPVRVTQLEVSRVVAPSVVPRQLDPVALRLVPLMLENADLRAELDDLRSA